MHLGESMSFEPSLAEATSAIPTLLGKDKASVDTLTVPVANETTTFGASASGSFYTIPRPDDPYCYQTGFGNRFSSEAM